MPDFAFHHAGLEIDAEGVATITIRKAKSLNILGTPVIADLGAAFRQLAGDASVRAVILRGSGDQAFVAGADIQEMAALDVGSARTFIDGLRQLCEAVRLCPVPVIARLPGWTLGGGLELAAACDIRIASDRAHFGMPEVKVGIPSIIHAALLPRLIGHARASWLLLTGDHVDAQRALSWGLVDAVVAPGDLDAEVARTAARFAACGAAVMRQQKRLLREWQHEPLEASIRKGVDEFASAFATSEPQRCMQAFLDEKARAGR